MKKLFAIFACAICFFGCDKTEKVFLDSQKVYFFYSSTCPHCHEAIEYINDVAPGLELEIFEVRGVGRDLFLQCVEKFDIPGDVIGTPLICMGDNYIMGWSPVEAVKFDEYVKPFIMTQLK